ncbi:esterase/lipase family protein [Actinomycetota bacterium]
MRALESLAREAVDVVGGAVRALATPTGLVGAAVETAWVGAHALTYPVGLLPGRQVESHHGYSIEHLPPLTRSLAATDIEAANTPILLVHGMLDNQSIWALMRRGLRRRGFGLITSMNYSVLTRDVRTAAAQLAQEVERIVEETGYERIHIIAHSMGGLISRYYITRLGGDEHVHTLVTLGTPHHGTYNAYAWPSGVARQMRPNSALMRELMEPVPECDTRFVVYWSDLDELVFPQYLGGLYHPDLEVRNVRLHGVGHMTIPILGSVVHSITSTLAALDPDGDEADHTVVALRPLL